MLEPPTHSYLVLVLAALGSCSGFSSIADRSLDASTPDLQSDGRSPPADAAPDTSRPCMALTPSIGPGTLGQADTLSFHSAVARNPDDLYGFVWEPLYEGSSALHFALTKGNGVVVVKGQQLDSSNFAPYSSIVAIGDSFAVIQVHGSDNPTLLHHRINSNGKIIKKTQLANKSVGLMGETVMVSGSAGVAVGYTYFADETKQVQIGKLGEDGNMATPFKPLTPTTQSRELALVETPTGYTAVWNEPRPPSCAAVIAARLDDALVPVGSQVVVAEGDGCYQKPSLARLGDDVLICAEHLEDDDVSIVCRLLQKDGTLSKKTISSVPLRTSRQPRVVAGGRDRFALFFTAKAVDLDEVYARLFTSSGNPVGDPKKISEQSVRSFGVTASWTGAGFLAGWYRYIPYAVSFATFFLTCEQ